MEAIFPLHGNMCGVIDKCENSIKYNPDSKKCNPYPKIIEDGKLKGKEEGFIRCGNYKENGYEKEVFERHSKKRNLFSDLVDYVITF